MLVAFAGWAAWPLRVSTSAGQPNRVYQTVGSGENISWWEVLEWRKGLAGTNAYEMRPAEQDPQGNWGSPTGGVQMSIRLDRTNLAAGEPLMASILLRNFGNAPLPVARASWQ